jgi:hypothetical protein
MARSRRAATSSWRQVRGGARRPGRAQGAGNAAEPPPGVGPAPAFYRSIISPGDAWASWCLRPLGQPGSVLAVSHKDWLQPFAAALFLRVSGRHGPLCARFCANLDNLTPLRARAKGWATAVCAGHPMRAGAHAADYFIARMDPAEGLSLGLGRMAAPCGCRSPTL